MADPIIPPITHPLGQYWDQPNHSAWLFDDTHVLMDRSSFEALAEYSGSNPSGAYEGKCWKRHDGSYDPTCPASRWRWLLCWYGHSPKPGMVSNNHREILLTDDGPTFMNPPKGRTERVLKSEHVPGIPLAGQVLGVDGKGYG